MPGSDQRRATRHKGKLPVQLANGQGITRDFNTSGVYFETNQSLSAGQPIEFSIFLRHVNPKCPVRLKCVGEIVRVDENGPKIGVAASITSYTFEELSDSDPKTGQVKKQKREKPVNK